MWFGLVGFEECGLILVCIASVSPLAAELEQSKGSARQLRVKGQDCAVV